MLSKMLKAQLNVGDEQLGLLLREGGYLIVDDNCHQLLKSVNSSGVSVGSFASYTKQTNRVGVFGCKGVVMDKMAEIQSRLIREVGLKLTGVELKRPCQYNREWVEGVFSTSHTYSGNIGDEYLILSSNGCFYKLENVSLYKDNVNCLKVIEYLAWLENQNEALSQFNRA